MLHYRWLRNNKRHQALLSVLTAPLRQLCVKVKPNTFPLVQSGRFCSAPFCPNEGKTVRMLLPCREQRARGVRHGDLSPCWGGTLPGFLPAHLHPDAVVLNFHKIIWHRASAKEGLGQGVAKKHQSPPAVPVGEDPQAVSVCGSSHAVTHPFWLYNNRNQTPNSLPGTHSPPLQGFWSPAIKSSICKAATG